MREEGVEEEEVKEEAVKEDEEQHLQWTIPTKRSGENGPYLASSIAHLLPYSQ